MDNPDLSPGTAILTRFHNSTDSSELVRIPVPSADPNDPLNWSNWRKYLNYGLTMAVTVAAFTNVSVSTVFWQQMTVDLNVTIQDLNNAQSAQLSGLALGCVVFIPVAIKYGRRPVYLVSTALLAAMSWWMSAMESYGEVVATAILSGLAGAVNETAVQMTISDLFFVHQRGSANGFYFMSVIVGSFVTPLAAGYQAKAEGWRWCFKTLAIALTILFALFLALYEETKYIPIDLGAPEAVTMSSANDDRAEVASLEKKGSPIVLTKSQPDAADTTPRPNTYRQRLRLLTPTQESLPRLVALPIQVITLPHVLFTSLQFASGVFLLVLFLSVTSVVFSAPPYNFDTSGVGLMALGPLVGSIGASFYGGPLSDWVVVRLARRNGGVYEPEMRLYPLSVPAVCLAGGTIMFGATAARGMHWIYPSIGGAFFAFGLGAMGEITFTLVIDSYRELTAEAFVGVAFLRNAVSVAAPFSMTPWMDAMGLSNMYIVAGCVGFFILMLHIPMIMFGKRIRMALAPRYWRLVEKKRMVKADRG